MQAIFRQVSIQGGAFLLRCCRVFVDRKLKYHQAAVLSVGSVSPQDDSRSRMTINQSEGKQDFNGDSGLFEENHTMDVAIFDLVLSRIFESTGS